MMLRTLIALCACVVSVHGIGGDNWLTDEATRAYANKIANGTAPTYAKRFTLNLDLAPEQRWTAIASEFKYAVPAIIAYFEAYIPKWLLPYIWDIGADIQSYFPPEFAGEMTGIAKAMGLEVGTVVAMNLIYQIEHIGQSCDTSNTTGPVPNCPPKKKVSHEPGFCTSALVPNAAGTMFHGRNLDWNIPLPLRNLMVDVDYQMGGKTIFTGSQLVGYVGLMHGVRHGGWTYSLNARDKGGSVLGNLLQALLDKSLTPAQHVRQVMQSAATFDAAVESLAKGPLVNMVYFNLAGVAPREAAVISRGRDRAVDVWRLSKTPTAAEKAGTEPFFLLQTNYDHWEPAPSYDDRRDPGIAHVEAVGQPNIDQATLLKVMTTWPTFNHHTDFTIVCSPSNASMYQTLVWSD